MHDSPRLRPGSSRHRSPAVDVADAGRLVLLSVLWGGSFFFVEIALGALPPLTLVCLRVGLAAPVLLLVAYATGERMPTALAPWRAFLVMGVLNNAVPFSLIVWAQTEITAGLASILNATTPLFAVLVAHHATDDEPLRAHRLAGVVLGIAGAVCVIGPQALAGVGSRVLAELAVVAAALAYALAGVYARRFRRMGITPIQGAAGQLVCSSLLLAPLALVLDRPWTLAAPSPWAAAATIALALASTAGAYVLYFRILERSGATNLLLVTLLIPVSALGLGVAFLDETVETSHLIGMALIGSGLAVMDPRLASRLGIG